MRIRMAMLSGALLLGVGCAHGTSEGSTQDRTAWQQTKDFSKDSWITTKIKSDYAVNKAVKGAHVSVATADGVVTLNGIVDTEYEAREAVRLALTTTGVREVHSNLRWPTMNQAARTFQKGDDINFRSRQ